MRNPSITDPVVNAARREQFSAAKIFGGFDSSSELAGMDTPTRIRQGGRVTMNLPGSDRAGPTGTLLGDIAHLGVKEGAIDTLANLGKAAGSIAMKPWSPSRWKEAISQNLGVKGVAGQLVDNLPAVHAGRIASMNVEDFFRGAQFKGLIRQGYSPEQASKVINRLHFDYGNLTEFEKGAMRRIFPFYTFMSRNIPLQAETLMTRPGIALSQLYPAQQERHKNPYVPDYLAGNVSVPLGETEPGKGRFIGTFGLPIEEAFSKFNLKGGSPDVRGTILGFMGNANPLIKGPMESLFNTQFYSGRKLSDLKAGSTARAIGGLFGDENPQMLAQALANTPFTRFVTSLDRATDARKPLWAKLLNLGTGVRVTDVDLDTQRAIEARDALSDMLGRQPHLSSYTNWFVKPEMQARMTPAEVELMRGLVSMQRRAKEYVDNRRRSGIGIAR